MKPVDDKTTINVQEEAKFLQSSDQDSIYLDPADVEEIDNGTDGEQAIEVHEAVTM